MKKKPTINSFDDLCKDLDNIIRDIAQINTALSKKLIEQDITKAISTLPKR
jgi:hypothetical protein